jgi:hypothetical protein
MTARFLRLSDEDIARHHGDVARIPSAAGSASLPVTEACDGPGADAWVTDLRDRVLAHDRLAHFAVRLHGQPMACEGEATSELDGARFGVLALTFSGGVTLEVETMPPEASITTLRAPSGFPDETDVREALQDHANGIGLAIDWTTPEVGSEGAEVVHTFQGPDPGLNASASLIYLDGELVAVRLSMAL